MTVIDWLLENADPSLECQVRRDLLHEPTDTLRAYQTEVGRRGYGRLLLDKRHTDGHWGTNVYNPKWTCTHYILFELVQLGISPENNLCRESSLLLVQYPFGTHGGINYARTVVDSDVCINGMILTITSYFGVEHPRINGVIDYIVNSQMADGGWNCEYLRGATHSSLHTTISILEGVSHYLGTTGGYRVEELDRARRRGIEFILKHELYKASTTGETIKDEFFRFCFPIRWKYDILRCLDYFRQAGVPYDVRMKDALAKIESSKDKKGTWKSYTQVGKTYGELEPKGSRGKWNTLRSLRVLDYYTSGVR